MDERGREVVTIGEKEYEIFLPLKKIRLLEKKLDKPIYMFLTQEQHTLDDMLTLVEAGIDRELNLDRLPENFVAIFQSALKALVFGMGLDLPEPKSEKKGKRKKK